MAYPLTWLGGWLRDRFGINDMAVTASLSALALTERRANPVAERRRPAFPFAVVMGCNRFFAYYSFPDLRLCHQWAAIVDADRCRRGLALE